MRRLDFCYDLNSPYAHLAFAKFDEFPADVEIRPKAVLLGAVFSEQGVIGPADIPAKRFHMYRLSVHLGERLGRKVRFPQRHPFHPVASQRLMAGAHDGAGATLDEVRAAFEFVFFDGRAPDNETDIAALADRIGLDPALATDPVSKAALRANTDDAISAGVFGAPTFVARNDKGEPAGPVFWGIDAIPMLLDWLADPEVFSREPYSRLADIEYGIRKKKQEPS